MTLLPDEFSSAGSYTILKRGGKEINSLSCLTSCLFDAACFSLCDRGEELLRAWFTRGGKVKAADEEASLLLLPDELLTVLTSVPSAPFSPVSLLR